MYDPSMTALAAKSPTLWGQAENHYPTLVSYLLMQSLRSLPQHFPALQRQSKSNSPTILCLTPGGVRGVGGGAWLQMTSAKQSHTYRNKRFSIIEILLRSLPRPALLRTVGGGGRGMVAND